MAVRKVELRLTTSGFEAANAALDRLSERLDRIQEKLDAINGRTVTPRVRLDGVDQADRSLDDLNLRLDEIGRRNVTARVRVKVDKSGGGLDGLLGGLFGGGSGGGGAIARDVARDAGGAAGGGGGGGAGSGILSSVGGASNQYTGGAIAALIALAASIAPAIIPFALGGGIGGAAGLGAISLGRKGGQLITADQQALAAARASIAGSKSGGSPSQLLALHQAQQKLAHDQGLYGGFLPLNSAVSHLGRSALNTFLGALTSNASGPHGGSRPGTSFLSGLTGIVNQIGPFLKSMGPELGQMLRASLPIVQTMVKVMEQFAKAVMPAITQSMKELKPYLPQIMQGFKYLSQGIADFIKDLGPGMRTSATVFKGLMDAVKGILIGIAYIADATAWAFARFGHNVMVVSHDVRHWFDEIRHAVAVAFRFIVNRVKQDIDHITNNLDHWRHDIAHIFDIIRHDISRLWDEFWIDLGRIVIHGVLNVIKWFHNLRTRGVAEFHALPGQLLTIGKNAMLGLLHGLEHAGASVLSWIGGFVSSIPGKFMSLLGIHSPSTVMHNIGLNIGQGLALGIDHSMGLVNVSASRLARSVPLAFSMTNISAAARRIYPGGPNAGAELVITAQGDDLVKAIVRALRYEIKNNGGGNVQRHLGWGSF